MKHSSLGLRGVKAIAVAALDIDRAHGFYGDILGLPPVYEGKERIGYAVGEIILMPKENWYAGPSDMPNPRVTLDAEHAPDTEMALRARGVVIADPVRTYDDFLIGSFLDSEGNKLWFCSPARERS